MATIQEIIRLITLRGKTEGVDKATAELRQLAGAQGAVAVATEKTEKSTLSLQGKINSLSKSLDAEYRAEKQLESALKLINGAREQGAITAARATQLSTLAAAKYKVEGESAAKAAEGLKLLKEVSLGFIGGIGAGVLLGGITELPTAIADAVERMSKLGNVAATIGITTKALQELRFAAKLSDVEVGTLDTAMEKFSTNLGKPGSPLNKILELNKVKVTGDVLTDLEHFADLVKNASNAEERNALITAAMGKSAQEMGQLFRNGGEGIAEWAKEADHAGIMTDAQIARARELNEELKRLEPQLQNAQNEFALLVMPAEITLLDNMAGALNDIRGALEGISQGNPLKGAALLMNLATHLVPGMGNLDFNKVLAGAVPLGQGATGSALSGTPVTIHGGATTKLPTTPDHAAEAQAKAIKTVTDALNLQIKNLTETNRQQFINNQLSQAHVTAASKEGAAIEVLAGKYYDQKQAIDAANQAAGFLAQTTADAFTGVIDGSESVVDAMLNVAKAIASAVIQAELLGSGPLSGLLGTQSSNGGAGGLLGSLFSGLLSGLGGGGGLHAGFNLSANGNVFSSAGLHPFVNHVVSRPTVFPFAKGVGLMGEAGPEAIMPLRRGADGRLGVSVGDTANGNSTVNHIDMRHSTKESVSELKQWLASGGFHAAVRKVVAAPGRAN